MVALGSLWLPMLLSAVACFLAGFVLWVVLPHHKSDWSPLPDEAGAMEALRSQNLSPGMYLMPHAGHDKNPQQNPEWVEKVTAGPPAYVVVLPQSQMLNMGPTLAKNFVYLLVMGVFVGYLASTSLSVGTDYLKVFQVTGTAALLGHSMGAFPKAIFWGGAAPQRRRSSWTAWSMRSSPRVSSDGSGPADGLPCHGRGVPTRRCHMTIRLGSRRIDGTRYRTEG